MHTFILVEVDQVGLTRDQKIELVSRVNQTPGTRIICEWCGALLCSRSKRTGMYKFNKSRFCTRAKCQNPYFANNQTKSTRDKRGLSMSGENHPLYGVGHTEEAKRKMSESTKGMYLGENNPFYGKHHTDEAKQRISASRQNYTNENHPWYGRPHTEESKLKMRNTKSQLLENYEYDPDKEQEEYRRKAIEYYGYVCEVCGCVEGMLVVHHINGDHYDDRIENLVVLCPSCHAKAHYKVDEHAKFIAGLNEEFRVQLLESRVERS